MESIGERLETQLLPVDKRPLRKLGRGRTTGRRNCPDGRGRKIFDTPGTYSGSVWLILSIQNGSALLLIAIEPLALGPQYRLCLPMEMSWPSSFVDT